MADPLVTQFLGPPSSSCSPILTFMTLVLSSIRSKCEAEKAREAARQDLSKEYDMIIVGGGGAGAVVAGRLSERPDWKVLVLERGCSEPDEAHVPGFTDITFESTPDIIEYLKSEPEPQNCAGEGCFLQAGNVLGGGTTLNYMMWVRGNRWDFDSWADITGDRDWSYKNVLPYFKKLERNLDEDVAADTVYHGRDGPLPVSRLPHRSASSKAVLDGWREFGLPLRDINGEDQLGYTFIQSQSKNGERWSTNRAYLQPALRRPNLEVRTFAKVRRVLVEETHQGVKRATGVEYRDAGGVLRKVYARKEVIVSAGALHTPQVLMLSGIGPAEHLKDASIDVVADLPVGSNLQDHILAGGLEFKCVTCSATLAERLYDILEYGNSHDSIRQGPLASRGPTGVGAWVHTNGSALPNYVPDVQIGFRGIYEPETGVRCRPFDDWRHNKVTMVPIVLHPASVGSVRLNLSDPHATPIVVTNYLGEEEDRATMLRGFHVALRLAEVVEKQGAFILDRTTMPGCIDHTFASDEYFNCLARTYTNTLWHFAGTARMGKDDDPAAVLDSRLRVKGISGLRVVDLSCVPHITSGNTMAPTIMLAEKASDLIKGDHPPSGTSL